MSALLPQISWSNHLSILSKSKTAEERHFYMALCVKENYPTRELSRQIDSGYYEGNTKSKRAQEKAKYQWRSEGVDLPLMHEKRTGYVSSMTKEEWLMPEIFLN